jgi:hypothetical protein
MKIIGFLFVPLLLLPLISFSQSRQSIGASASSGVTNQRSNYTTNQTPTQHSSNYTNNHNTYQYTNSNHPQSSVTKSSPLPFSTISRKNGISSSTNNYSTIAVSALISAFNIDLTKISAIYTHPSDVANNNTNSTTNTETPTVVKHRQSAKNYLNNDTSINLLCIPSSVYYYNKHYRSVEIGGYGVQIGYYKDIKICREDLKKYSAKFKIAGFVCDDSTLDNYRLRLILGHFVRKYPAVRLMYRLRAFFPFCFVVKYA